VPLEVCKAIYGDITGAKLDQETGLWSIPCDTEIDIAMQINGQIFPMHPLDIVPKSTTNPGSCVGSFVAQDVSAIAANTFDLIIGDNVLRSVYSVYDYGDFDASGNMGDPHVQLLSVVDPNAASKDFAAARGTVARTNITYNAANSPAASGGRTTVSLSDNITNTLNRINTYLPIMLAIVALNALVILLLVIAAFVYLFRRRGVLKRKNARRLTPVALEAVSTDTLGLSSRRSLQYRSQHPDYEPVSMALTDDTFVPPSPPFHYTRNGRLKSQPLDDRPKSVA